MRPLILSLFLLIPFASPLLAESQLVDQVVAVVNDEVITQSELDTLLRPIYMEYKKDYPDQNQLMQMMSEARQKLLNQLIEDRLVYQEAKSQKIEVDEVTLDQDIEEFKSRFKTESELEDALHQDGLNFNEMRERFRKQAMIRQLHDKEVRSHVVVSPLEVERYYKDHPEKFSGKDQIRVRSITVKKDEEISAKGLKDEAAKNLIEDLRKKIIAGKDFAELAKRFSEDTSAKEGGLGDWIEAGQMIPVIDDVIFKLKKDEVSQVIETPMGYHIFRLEERKEQYAKKFEEVRDQIYGMLFQQKSIERFQEWMKDLKRNAYISLR